MPKFSSLSKGFFKFIIRIFQTVGVWNVMVNLPKQAFLKVHRNDFFSTVFSFLHIFKHNELINSIFYLKTKNQLIKSRSLFAMPYLVIP
tara:strand:- start:2220 stop:2486 length:267 start_codon:yes stop_codon:yes gene_type:complete